MLYIYRRLVSSFRAHSPGYDDIWLWGAPGAASISGFGDKSPQLCVTACVTIATGNDAGFG